MDWAKGQRQVKQEVCHTMLAFAVYIFKYIFMQNISCKDFYLIPLNPQKKGNEMK
jgi:hypothetical protein